MSTLSFPAIPELGPVCRDEQRRALIHGNPDLNGIDYVEYDRVERALVVHLINDLPDVTAYGLTNRTDLIHIMGGTRVVGIKISEVTATGNRLKIKVDKEGDFSTYWLLIGWRYDDGRWVHALTEIDLQFSIAPVNFKATCPVDFDCRKEQYCPPEQRQEPLIDYLAKDYSSFRQLLFDNIARLNPDWLERSPADLGVALVELLAYTGDYLSYHQDAVANEAFLDTSRQRISAKRHARLIDYEMHDGRNAWTYIHIAVSYNVDIPLSTPILSRITVPFQGRSIPPGVVIKENGEIDNSKFESDPALADSRVFETTFKLEAHPENNDIFFHTWGNGECCLPRGTTSAYVYAVDPSNPHRIIRPSLSEGDFLLLEEMKSPSTGDEADADPSHRQVVRIIKADDKREDPLYGDQLVNGMPGARNLGNALPLLHITWRTEDALTFPLCVSSRPRNSDPVFNISVARGNIVLADHGRTIKETGNFPANPPYWLSLSRRPLTMQSPEENNGNNCGIGVSDPAEGRFEIDCDVRETIPSIALMFDFPSGTEAWTPVRHLMNSTVFDQHYAVDVDNKGYATIRFGDGTYGKAPGNAIKFTATYRIGNGTYGNIAADSLAHIVAPKDSINWSDKIVEVRNPLQARDGIDPETIEEVRQYAPAQFHEELYRAVTEDDYASALKKIPGVSGAVATFRWTGSWFTVYVGIDPENHADLVTEPGGRTHLHPDFEKMARAFITRYRLAGYDIEVRSGDYVPLAIDLDICVASDYFRADVIEAVYFALSNRINPDGSTGFFHWDNFTFGQAVYLSRLYTAVENVEGVTAVVATKYQRFRKADNGELEAGILSIGPWEIARLDNDPNFMENGVLNITARGGK
jgi:hypothetical protein